MRLHKSNRCIHADKRWGDSFHCKNLCASPHVAPPTSHRLPVMLVYVFTEMIYPLTPPPGSLALQRPAGWEAVSAYFDPPLVSPAWPNCGTTKSPPLYRRADDAHSWPIPLLSSIFRPLPPAMYFVSWKVY